MYRPPRDTLSKMEEGRLHEDKEDDHIEKGDTRRKDPLIAMEEGFLTTPIKKNPSGYDKLHSSSMVDNTLQAAKPPPKIDSMQRSITDDPPKTVSMQRTTTDDENKPVLARNRVESRIIETNKIIKRKGWLVQRRKIEKLQQPSTKDSSSFIEDNAFLVALYFASTSLQLWDPPGGVNSRGVSEAENSICYKVFQLAMVTMLALSTLVGFLIYMWRPSSQPEKKKKSNWVIFITALAFIAFVTAHIAGYLMHNSKSLGIYEAWFLHGYGDLSAVVLSFFH